MNMWDERYAGKEYAYGTKPNSFLVEQALKEPRGRVLSIAEGEGRNAVWLASQGFDVTSFDQSTVGVTKTLKLALHRSVVVHAFKDDMTTFEIEPNSYDIIVSMKNLNATSLKEPCTLVAPQWYKWWPANLCEFSLVCSQNS